ncbi:PIN/TRAM domain-containing protein [Eubacterium pyruvativorans]|uniref:PIN/TRAM domain-containing protein n=1 Tax=Eubacterium pyruvativorans TaxID=155865 RepID=UPI00240A13AD|nr:PIN domain-containing protein [Eubacterium pyruvativorans]MDD6707614.1 PIN domain nuclease [Eubacterium pyruvativorans]
MIRKLTRGALTVAGLLIGYSLGKLLFFIILHVNPVWLESSLSESAQDWICVIIALLFGLIFFKASPYIEHRSSVVANNIGKDLQNISTGSIVSTAVGLILGLLIATLLKQMFQVIPNIYIQSLVTVLAYLVLGYIGAVVGMKKGGDIVQSLMAFRRPAAEQTKAVKAAKKSGQIPKILDTSVIIDGRIADIMGTGFLEGPIVIPEFVLVELRHIADSADELKRARGRHGLDILNQIRDDYGVEIYNTDKEKSLKEVPEVDVKLLKLAQIMNGKVVTNDYNLNKVAGINGVRVLNINELANCLKPVVLPGEKMSLRLVKQGKDPSQAIGYLSDGTMIVVEDGRKMIGRETEITVTSVLQTSAGRMIFGRIHV